MKEELLEYIAKEIKSLEKIQYDLDRTHALIVGGQLMSLENMRKRIEKLN